MIVKWSDGIADDNMAEDILVDLAKYVARHPWWAARTALTLAILERHGVRPPARVLDVGCGWGTTLEALELRGYKARGVDISHRMLEALDRPGRELALADLTKPIPEGVPLSDAVLAMDVIEHIDDDRQAVERLGQLAEPGGLVVVSVPALPDLYSEFDSIQGHRRRYLPETLRVAFEGTGLAVEHIFYWGRWLVPILRRQRGKSKARPGDSAAEVYRKYLELPPWPASLLLRIGFAAEHNLTLDRRLKSGTSLFAIARKAA